MQIAAYIMRFLSIDYNHLIRPIFPLIDKIVRIEIFLEGNIVERL